MASKPQIGSTERGVFKVVYKRRGATKARTGCFCCKKRRVKCDETRPQCQRCITFGIKCDGYPSSPRPKRTANSKIVAITSTAVNLAGKRGTFPDIVSSSYIAEAYPKLLPSPSSILKFADEIEERNFRTFQTETALELTGLFDTGFWDSILLKACVEEPFAQKVAMAIAAMSTAKKLSHRIDTDQAYRWIIPQQTEFAYRQYHRALKEMRTSLEQVGDSRKALIGCLLVVCFESIVGNVASAHANATSGLKLVEHWLAQHPYKNQDEVGIKSPASHLLEDDILQAGLFFDAQVSSYLDPRPAAIHAKLRHEGDVTVKNMPAKFQTLVEAHRWAYLIFRRYVHCAHEIAELANDGRLSTPNSSDYSILDDGIAAMSLHAVEPPHQSEPPDRANASSPDFISMQLVLQQQCTDEMKSYRSAFHDLYERTEQSGNERDKAAARSMLAMCVSFDICVAQLLDTDNCSSDHLIEEYRQINSLLRRVILYNKARNPSQEFTFDFNVNQALHVSLRICRDRKVRREALELARMHGVSEGYHDLKYLIALCQKSMEIEEEGVETDYIPSSKRIRIIEETQHPGQRWSTVHYLRGFEDETVYKAEFKW